MQQERQGAAFCTHNIQQAFPVKPSLSTTAREHQKRVPLRSKACVPAHVQAELSTSEEDAHEDHRSYLIERLLPAMTHVHMAATGIAADDPPVPYCTLRSMATRVMRVMATRTTAELEGRMLELYDRLLLVRIAGIVIVLALLET